MRSGVLVLQHAEPSRKGHLNFLDFDFVHVQGGSILHMNWDVFRDFLAQLVVRDLVSEASIGGNVAVDALLVVGVVLICVGLVGLAWGL